MCGIAGILKLDGRPVNAAMLSNMIEAAHHRGPDGTHQLIHDNVGLAHKRLAIIDLHPRGRQPMDYQGRYSIVFNGEIYNYLELRSQLTAEGHVFVTSTDTEVILAAYSQWGPDCLSRFNGMWAFAIYDRVEKHLFVARDRFGVKPLALLWQPDMFCFASEIKQLLTVLRTRKVNTQRLLDYFLTSYENHTHETFFQGIEMLPAGSWMKIARDGKVVERQTFYDLPERPEYSQLSLRESSEAIGVLLTDAIRIRLRSDVPVGTCLSGGLDSSLITSIAANMYKEAGGGEFIGVHAKSIEGPTDESAFARLVAANSGVRLQTVEPSSDDFAKTIDEVIYTQEEPFGSPSMFMGWHVFREANLQGCKVMLNGQGADEVFLGYERYYPLELDPSRPVDFMRRIWLQATNSKLSLRDALQYYFYFRHSFLRIARNRSNRYIAKHSLAKAAFDSVRESADAYSCSFATQKLEIRSLQLPHLLRYEDRNSMRHSVETRLPFLDYRLVEAAASLPLEHKLNSGWTKYVVRKFSETHLPADVTWRREKLGFEAPSSTWFRSFSSQMRQEIEGSQFLSEFADMANVRRDLDRMNLRHKWALFNIAAWARIFEVSH